MPCKLLLYLRHPRLKLKLLKICAYLTDGIEPPLAVCSRSDPWILILWYAILPPVELYNALWFLWCSQGPATSDSVPIQTTLGPMCYFASSNIHESSGTEVTIVLKSWQKALLFTISKNKVGVWSFMHNFPYVLSLKTSGGGGLSKGTYLLVTLGKG